MLLCTCRYIYIHISKPYFNNFSLTHTHTPLQYRVIVTLYNFGGPNGGPNGEVIKGCFDTALRSDARVTRFRGKRALVLTLDGFSLGEMFANNIGPASSIGNPDQDPTLRPIVVGHWTGACSGGGGLVVCR